MGLQIVNITCPGCGARVPPNATLCEYCKGPIVITSFNSVAQMSLPLVNKYANAYKKNLLEAPDDQNLNTSIAMCYLKLRLYDKAFPAFEKAIEDNFDNSEPFFYAAVCLLKGKKAFLAKREDINRIEELVNAALSIESRGIYLYFLAYIKNDYFKRKFLNTSPTYEECLAEANKLGTSECDKQMLFELLNVAKPKDF